MAKPKISYRCPLLEEAEDEARCSQLEQSLEGFDLDNKCHTRYFTTCTAYQTYMRLRRSQKRITRRRTPSGRIIMAHASTY